MTRSSQRRHRVPLWNEMAVGGGAEIGEAGTLALFG